MMVVSTDKLDALKDMIELFYISVDELSSTFTGIEVYPDDNNLLLVNGNWNKQIMSQLNHFTDDNYHLLEKCVNLRDESCQYDSNGDIICDSQGNRMMRESVYYHIMEELLDDIDRVYNKAIAFTEEAGIDMVELYTSSDFISRPDKSIYNMTNDIKETFNKSLVFISHVLRENGYVHLGDLYYTRKYNDMMKDLAKRARKMHLSRRQTISMFQNEISDIYLNYLDNITNDTLKNIVKSHITYMMAL